jgi:penicillin-binding protein 2
MSHSCHLLTCLALVACSHDHSRATVPTKQVSITPATDASNKLQVAAVQEIVDQCAQPVAAAVLSRHNKQPVALVGHLGVEPTTLAARPGSTVKPILAWLAADAGLLQPNEEVPCNSTFESGFHCNASHGILTLPDAIAVSCNVYAFELAKRVGLERISSGYARFGLGQKTGLILHESSGFLATPQWVAAQPPSVNQRWDLLVGTGHGPIEVTPLQLALAYVKLLDALDAAASTSLDQIRQEIKEGLRRVVEDERGTAHVAVEDHVRFAGKTGTAEGGTFTGPVDGADNSWFVGFAPVENPHFVAAVVVVGGGQGVAPAAPIAGRILNRLVSNESAEIHPERTRSPDERRPTQQSERSPRN